MDELAPHLAKNEAEMDALRDEKITTDSIGKDLVEAVRDVGGLHLENGLSVDDQKLIETAKSLHTEPTS